MVNRQPATGNRQPATGNRNKINMNSKVKSIILFSMSLLILSSCEDVIDINLKNTEPKLVIESTITDQAGPYIVKLTKTEDYFDPGIYPIVSGADVIISDDLGNIDTLQETENGIYQTGIIQGLTGTTYSLSVWTEGKQYSAISTMPEKVNIDSLSSEFIEATPRFDDGYIIKCNFTDPPGINNYYRFKLYQKGELVNNDIYLRDDLVFDGNIVKIPIMTEVFQINDTVTVELLSLNKTTYDYFKTLADITEDGMGRGTAPANPVTNLSNGAMGYFGAFTISSMTIIIQ